MSTRSLPRWAVSVLLLVPAFGLGLAVSATASGSTTTTFYACLHKGTLSKVSTSSHSCSAGYTKVSWGTVGPPGSNGTNGTNGTPGSQGPPGAQGPAGVTVNACSSPPGPDLNFSACNLDAASWPGVHVRNTVFIDANLSSANLAVADMTSANLTNADLTNAILTGASLGCLLVRCDPYRHQWRRDHWRSVSTPKRLARLGQQSGWSRCRASRSRSRRLQPGG